jgi:hypothetical protein
MKKLLLASLAALGDLNDGGQAADGRPLPPIPERLAPASMAGFKAIQAAVAK